MFHQLTNFGFRRDWKEAIGFYIAWTLLSIAVVEVLAIFSVSIASPYLNSPDQARVLGEYVGKICGFVFVILFTVFILKSKGVLTRFGSIVTVVLSALVTVLLGSFLGMLIPAYLTTRSGMLESEVATESAQTEVVSKGLGKYLSLKGIFIGTVVNVIPSGIVQFVGFYVFIPQVRTFHESALQMQTIVSIFSILHPWIYQMLQIPGALFSILGGYVAARIAKRYELLNAGLSSVMCIVLAYPLFTMSPSAFAWPLWVNVLAVLVNLPLALLGGIIYLRTSPATKPA